MTFRTPSDAFSDRPSRAGAASSSITTARRGG